MTTPPPLHRPVRLVLAAEHEGRVLYQWGYACVRAETETVDIGGWGLQDPVRSYGRANTSVIDWEPGWPSESLAYPGERDWTRGELTAATRELP